MLAISVLLLAAVLVPTMNEAGLALFVLIGFLLPVPFLAWLDRPARRTERR
jgi:hypothetical protein